MPRSKQKAPTRSASSARKGANRARTTQSIKSRGVKHPETQRLLKKGDAISRNQGLQFRRQRRGGRKPATGFGQM